MARSSDWFSLLLLKSVAVDKVKNMEKAKEISQDENRKAQQRVQQVTDFHIGDIDKANKFKEAELMEV